MTAELWDVAEGAAVRPPRQPALVAVGAAGSATGSADDGRDAERLIGAALERVHAALDTASGPAADAGLTAELTDARAATRLLAETTRAISRLESIRLRVIAAAGRADCAGGPATASAAEWVDHTTRTGGARAAAAVKLADAVESGTIDATRTALAAGEVSAEHARVVAAALASLPEDFTNEERERVELALLREARQVDPARLRRTAKHVWQLAGRDPQDAARDVAEQLAREEDRAEAATVLTMHDNGDGTTTGRFTVPTLAASILRTILQAVTAPRRNPRTGKVEDEAERSAQARWASLDWAHRNGQAFVELLEHLPTDHLHGKTATTLVITMRLTDLVAGLGAGATNAGQDLSPGAVRRLACQSDIVPAVLGGASVPLDLGRSRRLYSDAQRVAIAAAYDMCAADGCTRPVAWAELHHEHPWSLGGRTNIDNAIPLCRWHHGCIHNPNLEHEITTDDRGLKVVTFGPGS